MNDVLQQLINQFMPFAQEHIGFEYPPKLFLKRDQKNANDPLGKTAFYDPEAKSITLYITGRHPKDILRSLGHELVHHKQNCCGEFEDAGDMGPGYAQRDPHLRDMEEKANLHGSMCLRDFEDLLKKENTIYYEHFLKGEKSKMSIKDWKNKEISILLSEAWGFKFNSLQEFDEFNGTGEIQEEGGEELEELTYRGGPDPVTRAVRHKRTPVPEPPTKEDEDESLEEGDDADVTEEGRSEHAAEASGMAAMGEEGEEAGEAGKKPRLPKDPEYMRGYKKGKAASTDSATKKEEGLEEATDVADVEVQEEGCPAEDDDGTVKGVVETTDNTKQLKEMLKKVINIVKEQKMKGKSKN